MSSKYNFQNPSLEMVHDKISSEIAEYVNNMSYSTTTDLYQLGAERGYLVALRQFAAEIEKLDKDTTS